MARPARNAPGARTEPRDLAEHGRKVGRLLEAALQPDLDDRQVGSFQQLASPLHAETDQEAVRRLARGIAERTYELRRAQPADPGELLERQRFIDVRPHVVDDAPAFLGT